MFSYQNWRKVPKEFSLVKFVDSSCHLPNPDVHTPMVRLEGQGDEWWEDRRLRETVTAVCGQSQENVGGRGWLDHAGRKQEHAWQAASEPLKRQSERWLEWTLNASQLESQTQAGWFEYHYYEVSWADSKFNSETFFIRNNCSIKALITSTSFASVSGTLTLQHMQHNNFQLCFFMNKGCSQHGWVQLLHRKCKSQLYIFFFFF